MAMRYFPIQMAAYGRSESLAAKCPDSDLSGAFYGAPAGDPGTDAPTLPEEFESVTLVDTDDNEIGSCGKLAAHRDGRLHRAFSILISNRNGELLLQRRAAGKYHFAKRWSNSCCGHPRPGEPTIAAAGRRLGEEFGFTVPLKTIGTLQYRVEDSISGLIENEYLHVLHGRFSGEPRPHPDEIGAYRWMQPGGICRSLARRPDWFTPWFALLVDKYLTESDSYGWQGKS
jgi:isopentenyl-diphosphate delta-isomerase